MRAERTRGVSYAHGYTLLTALVKPGKSCTSKWRGKAETKDSRTAKYAEYAEIKKVTILFPRISRFPFFWLRLLPRWVFRGLFCLGFD